MHGMKQICVQLTDLCPLCDIIFVQEHWLLSSNLDCFDTLSSDHISIACSAMDDRCSKGILKGRPFGGLCLFKSERLICLKLGSVIIVNVYFPTFSTDVQYIAEVSDLISQIEIVLNDILVVI